MYRGLCFYSAGWTGQVELDASNTTAPSAHTSATQLLAAVKVLGQLSVDASFDWSLTPAGLVVLFSDIAFDLTFTGNAGTRLGFTSGPWTGARIYTADVVAHGLWAPHADHAVSVWADVPVPDGQGVRSHSAAALPYTPATAWRRPRIDAECDADAVLDFRAAFEVLSAPTKVDTISEAYALTTYQCGGAQVRTVNALDGWSEITVEVARVG